MNDDGEHGPLPDPALGNASPSDDPPEPPVEREGAGTELARDEESDRQTETPPG